MAGASLELREIPYLRLFPWLRLLRGVRLALEAKKLILAALGLMVLSLGWGVLNAFFPSQDALWLRVVPEPLPSPFATMFDLRGALADAFGLIALPAQTVVGPFLSLFAISPAPGQFWQAFFAALWAVVVWGIFGGAIARIAVVQVATGERVGLVEALRFAVQNARPLIAGPLIPIAGALFFAVPLGLMGLGYRLPSALVWTLLGVLAFVPLLAGLVMAVILLVVSIGWPLMHVAAAAEREDAFDVISRSFAYVLDRPARYAAYAAVAWLLGTFGVLLVGTFQQAAVSLALWSLSFGAPDTRLSELFQGAADPTLASRIHAGWIKLVNWLAFGWLYSYFWTSASIIYLLLRHDVDGTDWHDVAPARPRAASPPPVPEPAGQAAAATDAPQTSG